MIRKAVFGIAVPCLVMAGLADGASIRFMGNGDYLDAAGWQGGVIPGDADQARINWGDNTVTLSGAAPDIENLQTGVNESGTLIITTGGSLTSEGWSMIGTAGGGATGTLIVENGGEMSLGAHFWSGVGGSTGRTEINGGTINVGGILGLGTVDAVNPSGGVGFITVNDGGLLALTNIHGLGTSIQPGSLLDIRGTGQVTLPGNFVGSINDYIGNSQIAGNGVLGAGALRVDLTTNPGFTTITAIPEPSASSLIGLLVAGAVFVRRRRRVSR